MGFVNGRTPALLSLLLAVYIGIWRYSVVHIKRTTFPEGDLYHIPVKGFDHWAEFVTKTADTNGEFIAIKAFFPAGFPGVIPGKSASPPLHVHQKQLECFTVLEGTMGYLFNGTTDNIHTTEDGPLCLPPGLPHAFYNAENTTDMLLNVKIKPALHGEGFFRTLAGFEVDFGKRGGPGLLQILVTFVRGDVRLCDFPEWMWAVFTHAVVPFAETVLGYKPFYPEYTRM